MMTNRSLSHGKSRTELPAWKALSKHYESIQQLHLRQFFAEDPNRGDSFTAEAAGLYLDYSKNRITAETLRLQLQVGCLCPCRNRNDESTPCGARHEKD